ncbi:uncharacterized protein ARMOST_17556 [Armillaria ostoyae]|uniref:Uncharacterized protein n=1 Tax=Armillaria ostoyae TaxID=47428 RepID=A0A284RZB1_ARMOS|nr:uncharacterized protein ARMOST_17556 [Armillaria ostoyae]
MVQARAGRHDPCTLLSKISQQKPPNTETNPPTIRREPPAHSLDVAPTHGNPPSSNFAAQTLPPELVDSVVDCTCKDDTCKDGMRDEDSNVGNLGLVCHATYARSRVNLFKRVNVDPYCPEQNSIAVGDWFEKPAHRELADLARELQWRGLAEPILIDRVLSRLKKVTTLILWESYEWPTTTPRPTLCPSIERLVLDAGNIQTSGLHHFLCSFPNARAIEFIHGAELNLTCQAVPLPTRICELRVNLTTIVDNRPEVKVFLEDWTRDLTNLRSLTITAEHGANLKVAKVLIRRNVDSLVDLSFNTAWSICSNAWRGKYNMHECANVHILSLGVLDDNVLKLAKILPMLPTTRLKRLWVDIHILMLNNNHDDVDTRSRDLFNRFVPALQDFLARSAMDELGMGCHYYGGKPYVTVQYMERVRQIKIDRPVDICSHNYFYEYRIDYQ